MPISKQYIKNHKTLGYYCSESVNNGYVSYNNKNKWNDYVIDDCMIYSHRTNKYTRKNFTEGLHT